MVRIDPLEAVKCNQFGKGVDIFVGRIYTDICPVTEILRYVALHGPAPGPLFIFDDGPPYKSGVH